MTVNDPPPSQGKASGRKVRSVEILVNGKPVGIVGKQASGLVIKQEAIIQGVNIQPSFMLQQELPNGSSLVIGDNDVVSLRPHLRFTAIAPDDNS